MVFAGPQAQGEVFLDLVDRVGPDGPEQGLIGLAFAPNFTTSGYLFVNYTDKNGDTVISRYHISDSNHADRRPLGLLAHSRWVGA